MANATENVIVVKNLKKSYMIGTNESVILHDINFKIKKGEFVSIMGPSGVGKSTLLYLLGGLDKPTSGKILIGGKNITAIREKEFSRLRRQKIGFVFQFYNLVNNLSIEDNIMLPLLLDGKKRKNYTQKLDEILDLVGLKDKRNLTPRELSGGQQQRVAIARSLIYEPDILFLDEPIGNLDSKNGTEVMELFKKINSEFKKTIIQVTHSEEAAQYGTVIYRMKDGRISNIEKVVRKKS